MEQSFAQRRRIELTTGAYPDNKELLEIADYIKDCALVNNFTKENKQKAVRLVQIAKAYDKRITNFCENIKKLNLQKPKKKLSDKTLKRIAKMMQKSEMISSAKF